MVELPKRDIYAPLVGKKVLLGVTGSSAIYKSIDLARKLIRMGAEVEVMMTREAASLITPKLFEWAVNKKPLIELTGKAEHIELAEWADAIVIAPATLNIMSKIAYGIADEPLSLTTIAFIGRGKKVIIAPAMNYNLYNTPQRKKAEEILREHGVYIINPMIEENKAKYPPIDDLAYCIEALVNRGRDLEGKQVLVTAGPTMEYIDPVRVVTNPSSGLMGVLIARELVCRGASVDVVHGPIKHRLPYMVKSYQVYVTSEMAETVYALSSKKQYDAAVFAAAPADYKPARKYPSKIPTSSYGKISIELVSTPKVVEHYIKPEKGLMILFAAETVEFVDDLVEKARSKLVKYNGDLIVANIVGTSSAGFSSEYIRPCIVDRDGYQCYGTIRKEVLARIIADIIASKATK